ncbi:ABC transporter permease [Polaribacter sp.]|uniref:ABC transporter permease n=1 Tax=Polaribacter sp. TaxID=1920175 RepID=UPI003F6A579D
MFKNYFKIALRNIAKHKVFSFINVIGLTIGLSASFIIGLMVYYDYTFDNFHKDGDRIYRVVSNFTSPEGKFYNSGVTLALEDAIRDNSNFESVSGFYVERPSKVENVALNIEKKWPKFVVYTDEDYFDIFQYKFLAGDKTLALKNPNCVILTTQRAAEYFPKLSPQKIIGKTLLYNDSVNVKVTGIVANLKGRTDFVFQEFLSTPTALNTRLREEFLSKNWNSTNSSSQLFVKVSKAGNFKSIQQRFEAIATEHIDDYSKKYNQKREFILQPLNDIHFNNDYGIYNWEKEQASKDLLQNLVLVAVFLLVLGCINFINLNTAIASQRAREIGVRKTLGSSRAQIISQFMGETFVLVLIATILSLLVSNVLLNVFSDFIASDISLELLKSPIMIISILILLVLVTFLSGYYPALSLSKFNTVTVLKNTVNVGKDKVKFRKFLTIFQFTIAQVFIIATLLVSKQINFMLEKDMGFKTNAIVSIYSPRSEIQLEKKQLLAQKIKEIPAVEKVSIGGYPPASRSTNIATTTYNDGVQNVQTDLQMIAGDTSYASVFELKLLAGRKRLNDTIKELIINETARKTYGFATPNDAIGKMVEISGDKIPIVGVMNDFNQRSLKSGIRPMALSGDWYRQFYSRFQAIHVAFKEIESSNLNAVMDKIQSAYGTVYTEIEDYRADFIDETITNFYKREQKISKLLNWATGLSILISFLGLFGLVIYTTNRRVKEIGIRKVLGASLFEINTLLCKEFLVLVGIAFVIAAPIAWYGTYNWLQDFAYKTQISFWVFLLSGFAMILFALIVISIKTIQAATANPVHSLRSE